MRYSILGRFLGLNGEMSAPDVFGFNNGMILSEFFS